MSYLSKNQRYTLMKLTNVISSEQDIREKILQREHQEELVAKGIPETISYDEKNFFSRWLRSSNIELIRFNSIEEDGEDTENTDDSSIECRYIKAVASCEFSTRQIKNPTTKELLPKNERLNTAQIDILFVESKNEWYCIAFTSNFYDLKRAKKLIGEFYIEQIPADYQVSSELFDWLFYKYSKEETSLTSDITLDNIAGFTGTVVSDENRFQGRSDQTADLIITKAFIANRHPLTSILISLQMSEGSLEFYLSEISGGMELQITVLQNSSLTQTVTSHETENIISIYTLFYVIPKLIEVHKTEASSFLSKKDSFLSLMGIEVIKTIMAKNDITIDQLR